MAALHTQKTRTSPPDLHVEVVVLPSVRLPKLQAHSCVLPQVDVVGQAVVTAIFKKKKQRGRSESDAPPKKKEFLRRQHGKRAPALPSWRSAFLGSAHVVALCSRPEPPRKEAFAQGRPLVLLGAATSGLRVRTGQPSRIDHERVPRRCPPMPARHDANPAAFRHLGPPMPRPS